MTLKKLPKNKSDIIFINPRTMEKECTYNTCFEKFVETSEYVIKTPQQNGYKPIKHLKYYHKCEECGRVQSSSEDKSKTVRDYQICSFHEPELTESEKKMVVKQLKNIFKSTKIPEKKDRIQDVIIEYSKNL